MFKTSEFIISAVSRKQSPNKDNKNEYVFLGRSNVGKSSLINCLCNKKNLARVSSNPGKTITLNYYLIDNSFYLVDVPGYGFANRSKDMKDSFGNYIDDYLQRKKPMPKRSVAALSRSSLTLGSAMEISNLARSHNDLLRKYTIPCSVAMY